MAANSYEEVTFTPSDFNTSLKKNRSADDYKDCFFYKGPAGETIDGVAFSFAKFDGCTFEDGVFDEGCNFTGVEGDSLPGEDAVSEACNCNFGAGSWGNRTDYLESLPK